MKRLHSSGSRLISPTRPAHYGVRAFFATAHRKTVAEASTSEKSDLTSTPDVEVKDKSLHDRLRKRHNNREERDTDIPIWNTSPPKPIEKLSAADASLAETSRRDRAAGHIIERLEAFVPQDAPPTKKKKNRTRAWKRKMKLLKAAEQSAPPALQASVSNAWPDEAWSDNWGEDKLVPSDQVKLDEPNAPPPPHMLLHAGPPSYSRRIEGLLRPVTTDVLQDVAPTSDMQPVAKLAHGLDRVLFNPGVHWLQDPRSRVYNFAPWLENIPSVQDFAFERISPFVKSSRDQDLWNLCRQENRLFGGSTSSLTGMLSQIYFLISGNQEVDTTTLSSHFNHEKRNFTPGQRMPVSVIMNHDDGVYAIDSDSGIPGVTEKNILTWLGHVLEKFLTKSEADFTQLLRSSPEPSKENVDTRKEAFRYSKSEKFVMRSQLDAQDSRLPGTGVFDIKTRAALPIRLDMLNYEENSDYQIHQLHGALESFEKEYFDLIRSAFLKYSFQARIGNMDGVLVAYHNTSRMFGFQYVPLEEMDSRLYGRTGRGPRVFEKCVGLLEQVAEEMIKCFPKESIQATFETEEDSDIMYVWVEPLEWDGSKGPRPIARLDVTSCSYVDNLPVRKSKAIKAVEQEWVLHYTISHSALDAAELRFSLDQAKARKIRAFNLPSGVELADMGKIWQSINYGGAPSIAPEDRDAENEPLLPRFRPPSRNVRDLRQLARDGRARLEAEAKQNEGKRKIVWGEPEFETGDADYVTHLSDTDHVDIDEVPAAETVPVRTDIDESALGDKPHVPLDPGSSSPIPTEVTEDVDEAVASEVEVAIRDNTSSGDPYLPPGYTRAPDGTVSEDSPSDAPAPKAPGSTSSRADSP